MHPVRQTILEILKRERHATVAELAEQLKMAPVSVRHHLDLLIGDNLVSTPRVRRSSGAGRPQRIYALTAEADSYFPNNYRQLADECLRALKQALSPEQIVLVMGELASRTALQAPKDLSALPLQERLEAVAEYLTTIGYMAELQVDEDTLVLHTCNCPYAELAPSHQELCYMDLQLMCRLSGLEPQRIAHIAEGAGRCSYRIQPDHDTDAMAAPLVLDIKARSVARV